MGAEGEEISEATQKSTDSVGDFGLPEDIIFNEEKGAIL